MHAHVSPKKYAINASWNIDTTPLLHWFQNLQSYWLISKYLPFFRVYGSFRVQKKTPQVFCFKTLRPRRISIPCKSPGQLVMNCEKPAVAILNARTWILVIQWNNFQNQTCWSIQYLWRELTKPPGFVTGGYPNTLGNSNYLKATIMHRTIQKTPSSSDQSLLVQFRSDQSLLGWKSWPSFREFFKEKIIEKQQAIRYGQLEAIGDFNPS